MKVTLGSLNEAADAIRRYRDEIGIKADILAEKVATQIGAQAAHLFNSAYVNIKEGLTGEPEKADVSVSINKVGTVYVVIADGPEAVFIEFGAGVYSNNKPSPHPRGTELGMTIGSYGKGRGNRLTWGYRDETGEFHLTHGTPAAMPMYKAAAAVRDNIITIAREVFG